MVPPGPFLWSLVPHDHPWSHRIPRGPTWFLMVPHGSLWSQMVPHGGVLYRMVPFCAAWSHMVQHGPKWSQMVSNGSTWFQRVPNGSLSTSHLVHSCHFWYHQMSVRLRWKGALSSPIKVQRGTRQGGLSSPLAFNLFYHPLIEKLNS